MVDVTIKDKAFRLIGVYGPNATSELPAFFRRIEPYVSPSIFCLHVSIAIVSAQLDNFNY